MYVCFFPRNNKKQFLSILLYSFHSLAYPLPAVFSFSLALPAALINSMPRNGRVSNELLMDCLLLVLCLCFCLIEKIVIYTYIFFYVSVCVLAVCVCVFLLYDSACLTHNLVVQNSPCCTLFPLLNLSVSLSFSLFLALCNMCITYSMNWNCALESPGMH